MNPRRRLPLLTLFLLAALFPREAATAPPIESKVTDPTRAESKAGDAPGLHLHLSPIIPGSSAGGTPDVQAARHVALHVPQGEAVSPFLPKGRFRAQWTGSLHVGLRGRYTFSVEGRGKVEVSINQEVVLKSDDAAGDLSALAPAERIRLNKGPNAIVVWYESPEKGDATLRLMWESDEFPREPVPPTAFTHPASMLNDRFGGPRRAGRDLFATMRCVRCHEPPAAMREGAARVPELDMDAPNLTDIGVRLNKPWMAHWIQDPGHFRADATMPRLLPVAEKDAKSRPQASQQAWDIAAYLDTLGLKPPVQERKPDTKESIAAGGHLFASLGCIGCHTPPGAGHADEKIVDGRLPLKWVAAKYQRDALAPFLMNPQAHYAWIRMPNFRLSAEEANNLAAFLFSLPRAKEAEHLAERDDHGDPVRGKQLIATHGCLNCHEIPGGEKPRDFAKPPTLAAVLRNDWPRGCVTPGADAADAKRRGSAPDFAFTESQVESLRTFAAASNSGWGSLINDTPRDFATRQIAALRCSACHKRDGNVDAWSNHETEVASWLIKKEHAKPKPEDDEDPFGIGAKEKPQEVQIDQSRPDLTWIGDKLRPQWLETFLAGKLDYKLRPWIEARMPAFPIRARGLAQGLALDHGREPVAPDEPKPDPALATIGRQLIGPSIDSKPGFSCTQCHAIGNSPATNVFEAQGINFAYTKERLRRDYYLRWMLKPSRIAPGTRMPQFAADDGTTPFTDLFEGDGRKQFDAMWQYLMSGREIVPP